MSDDFAVYTVSPEQLAAEAALRQVKADRAWGEAAEKIGIPKRYLKATLFKQDTESFPPGVAAAIWKSCSAMINYLNNDLEAGRALVLCGPPGTGKTHAAAAALIKVYRSTGFTDRMFWKTSMLRASLMDMNRRGAILDSLITTPLLVLDDVGMEFSRDGDYFETTLDAVIDTREAEMRPLIVTSNLVPEKLAAKLGPRAWDRLSGDWGTIKTIVGPSARKSLQPPRPDERA